MRSLFHCLLGVVAAALFFLMVAGCNDLPHRIEGPECGVCSSYWQPTAPESLISNLQMSYRSREIKPYSQLLAPEFIFKFQPQDANDIGTPFWTRDQDSTGTRALFATTEVSDIRINLIYGRRDSSVNMSPPVDSLKIRIITTDLQVDQTDGTVWVVTDQQDLFFRQGLAANRENPSHWLIYEWDDLPTLGSPKLGGVRGTTWGNLKTQY
jgi:hypothetical protein